MTTPATLAAELLMQDAAEILTGDRTARCVLIVEPAGGECRAWATTGDVDEIRGLMFRAAQALPDRERT